MIEPIVVATGSRGNCIVYGNIIVDAGVSYKKMEPYIRHCRYLLLTHEHGDHIKEATLRKINTLRPDIMIITPYYLVDKLLTAGIRNVCEIKPDVEYQLPGVVIKAHELVHDVLNVGYSMEFQLPEGKTYKIFHATDTYSLSHIEMRGYDLYAIEYNHDEIQIQKDIEHKKILGVFAHEVEATFNHHSFQRANAWLNDMADENSQVLKLHLSSTYAFDENGVIYKVTTPEQEETE